MGDGALGLAVVALLCAVWRGLPSWPWTASAGEAAVTEVRSAECRCYVEIAAASVIRDHLVLIPDRYRSDLRARVQGQNEHSVRPAAGARRHGLAR